ASGLANDNQRRLFTKRAALSQQELIGQAMHHVAQQSDVFASEVLKGTIDTESRVAAAGGDIPTSLLRMNAAIDRQAARFGLPEEMVTSMKMSAADSLWTARVKGLINTNPLAARTVYEAHATEIGPQNRPVLEHEIKTAVTPIEAKAIADYVI